MSFQIQFEPITCYQALFIIPRRLSEMPAGNILPRRIHNSPLNRSGLNLGLKCIAREGLILSRFVIGDFLKKKNQRKKSSQTLFRLATASWRSIQLEHLITNSFGRSVSRSFVQRRIMGFHWKRKQFDLFNCLNETQVDRQEMLSKYLINCNCWNKLLKSEIICRFPFEMKTGHPPGPTQI